MDDDCGGSTGGKSSQPVAGVIGAAFSGVSIMVANILRLFKVRKEDRIQFPISTKIIRRCGKVQNLPSASIFSKQRTASLSN